MLKYTSRLNHKIKIYHQENIKYINELSQKNFDEFIGPILLVIIIANIV